jgi:hypothetical protein
MKQIMIGLNNELHWFFINFLKDELYSTSKLNDYVDDRLDGLIYITVVSTALGLDDELNIQFKLDLDELRNELDMELIDELEY